MDDVRLASGGSENSDNSALSETPTAPLLAGLHEDLESFGLAANEARVLLALLQLGSATPSQVARLSGLGRTSVYPVLESLRAKHVAEPSPADNGTWLTPGRREVIERLCAAEESRLADLRDRKARTQARLAELGPESAGAVPYVHLLRDTARVKNAYQRLLDGARSELLMFTRPPYTYVPGDPNPAVLAMLKRGVKARVLYEPTLVTEPEAAPLRREVEIYHRAGVQARVTARLPVKLVIADRNKVMFSTTDPVLPDVGFPTTLLIEHPDVASFAVIAFEQMWSSALPYEEARADQQIVTSP